MRALLIALLVLAVAPAAAEAQDLSDRPDLTIELPAQPYQTQTYPVYVDTFQEPGKVLYRFDAIIHNGGGTLDLYGERDPGALTVPVNQKIWPDGEPTTPPEATEAPPDGAPVGGDFRYVVEETHEHWHFFSAARYELDVPGEGKRVSDKIGFCMFDSFDTNGVSNWFPGSEDWCRFNDPDADVVRMGLSRGAADRYAAQREFQYVDVTGLVPGTYVLRGIANPGGQLLESDETNNVIGQFRVLPGVRALPRTATTGPGAPLVVMLGGEIVAPEIPARRDGGCRPSQFSASCYVEAGDEPLAFAIAEPPQHGSVTLAGATATYTPAPGFAGADRFTYTATDARGLASTPAAVDVTVVPAGTTPPPPPPPPPPAATPKRLLRIGAARRVRRALLVPIACRPAATGSCAGTVDARLAGRRLDRRTFAGLPAGRSRTIRLRLSRADRRALTRAPRRRIVLTATVRDGLALGVQARRVVERPVA